MYREKAEWLIRIGQPMWSLEHLEKDSFIKRYDKLDCFIAYVDDDPLGGFVLLESDDFLWGPKSHLGVYYIHKLVVKDGYAGQGYAQKIMSWIDEYARNAGKEKLRLDCYEGRKYLMRLYTECGYHLVNIKMMPDGIKIAQFEKQL
jgi:GNAT superfamily N-acetyltransferase